MKILENNLLVSTLWKYFEMVTSWILLILVCSGQNFVLADQFYSEMKLSWKWARRKTRCYMRSILSNLFSSGLVGV